MLSLRPRPPGNTSSQRSLISSSLTWCLVLLYFGFRGFHYLILFAPFFQNVFTMDDPTIKVNVPFGTTYFLLCCPCTNSPGIWNQAPVRRDIVPWRTNYYPFTLSASHKVNKGVHYLPLVGTHILGNITFPTPTWDQNILLPLTPILHGQTMK